MSSDLEKSAENVVFCLGTVKSGTTWLYRYFYRHPQFVLPAIKELHFFDAVDNQMLARWMQDIDTNIGLLKKWKRKADLIQEIRFADAKTYRDVLQSLDEERYKEYLQSKTDTGFWTGDFTPCYSILSEERLGKMSGMFENARFVLLLRDPIDRLWSHVRMIAKRRADKGEDITKRARYILNNALGGNENPILARGDYPTILDKMDAAIPPENLFIMTYEEMLAQENLDRLCAYLDVEPQEGAFASVVHKGVSVEMREEERALAANFLAPHYDYIENRFGKLPQGWDREGHHLVA